MSWPIIPRYLDARELVVGRLAVDVKAKRAVSSRDLKGLLALREENLLSHFVLVSLEPMARRVDGIDILPWREFLTRLWEGVWPTS